MTKPWRYVLSKAAITSHPALAGIEFTNSWMTISKSVLCVRQLYAWDGASPAVRVPNTRLWLGPWDGPLMPDGHPAAYRATLFHDALCQFRHEISGLTRYAASAVFAAELQDSGAPGWMCWLYPRAANIFGPQDFPGDGPHYA